MQFGERESHSAIQNRRIAQRDEDLSKSYVLVRISGSLLKIRTIDGSHARVDLAAGRDFEQSAALRVRGANGSQLCSTVKVAVRRLDQHVGRITLWTRTELLIRARKTEELGDVLGVFHSPCREG